MDTLGQSRVGRNGKRRKELAERLSRDTQGEVLFNNGDRGRYATDASIYQTDPIGVLIPKTFEDVRVALDICRDMQAPIIARGAGSSQCGQTVGHALILDNSKYLRSEEHTSELQSLMRISYAVFCLKKKNHTPNEHKITNKQQLE